MSTALERMRTAAAAPTQNHAPQNPSPSHPPSAGTPRHLQTGDDIWEEAAKRDQEAEQRRENSKYGFVQDFYISQKEAAADKTKTVIVLDAKLSVCGFNEHAIMEGKKFVGTEICVKDWATCPLCAKGFPSYVLKLTILDTTPYEIQSGDRKGQVIPFARKMVTIKSRQRAKWREIEQNCIKQNGTFRGCMITLKRDKSDANSASLGEPQQMPIPVEVPGRGTQTFFQLFDFVPEDVLVQEFGSPAKIDNGKEITIANVNITPYDYARIFPEPNLDELNRKYGGGTNTLGNAAQAAKEWDQPTHQPGQQASQPATASSLQERLRLRGGSSLASALPAAQPTAEDFDNAPQGELGKPIVPDVVVKDDDQIPFA